MSSRDPKKTGSIELIIGSMFSGKSKLLLERLRPLGDAGRRIAIFKHGRDNRYSTSQIVTHDGQSIEATPVETAEEIATATGEAEVVAVDEVQFFGPPLADVCRSLSERGITLVLSGLYLDAWGLPFDGMPEVRAVADQVTELFGVCAVCGRPADRHQRISPITAYDEMVGGSEAFEPRCQVCFTAPPMELRR